MKVGSHLFPGRTLPEGVMIEGGRGWVVLVSLDNPTASEIRAVERGRVEVSVALGGEGHVLVWALKTSTMGWSASAWAPWERSALEQELDGKQVIQVVVVDGRDTRVRAIRTIGLSPNVAAQLAMVEAAAVSAGRNDAMLEVEREWTLSAEPAAIAALAKAAQVVTWVDSR